MTVLKIISGGQTGADIAALRVAKRVGLQTGGWMPRGFKTLDGPKREYRDEYNIMEHHSSAYPPRTERNVYDSDGTLRLAHDFTTAGERCTLRAVLKYQRPCLDVDFRMHDKSVITPETSHSEVIEWIDKNNIQVLNVAGNAGIEFEPSVENFLAPLFLVLKRGLRLV